MAYMVMTLGRVAGFWTTASDLCMKFQTSLVGISDSMTDGGSVRSTRHTLWTVHQRLIGLPQSQTAYALSAWKRVKCLSRRWGVGCQNVDRPLASMKRYCQ